MYQHPEGKMFRPVALSTILLLLAIVVSGCALRNAMDGDYFIRSGKYAEGVEVFTERLRQNPDDAEANYYMGRYLLALERPIEARQYLERAVRIAPGEAEYHFRLGLAHLALNNPEMEERCYEQAVSLEEGHSQAQLYLGHIYLAKGKKAEALKAYDRVLAVEPDNEPALYNRALILRQRKGLVAQETAAWKTYLTYHPQGKWAIPAVEHLNERGDFEYRCFQIGYRKVAVHRIDFKGSGGELEDASKTSLKEIGSILDANRRASVEITAYYKKSQSLAIARAQAVQEQLLKSFPHMDPTRLTIRGIGKPEQVRSGGRTYYLQESVVFTTTGL
jgi:tetratricopeptide (TPR) repeat protein